MPFVLLPKHFVNLSGTLGFEDKVQIVVELRVLLQNHANVIAKNLLCGA